MANQLATLILLRYKEREDEAKKLSKNSASKNDSAVCRSRKREA